VQLFATTSPGGDEATRFQHAEMLGKFIRASVVRTALKPQQALVAQCLLKKTHLGAGYVVMNRFGMVSRSFEAQGVSFSASGCWARGVHPLAIGQETLAKPQRTRPSPV
jgi:hypothetical protein